MLLVVCRPADREAIGQDTEQRPADRKNGDERVQAFAPASASSTSVAWVTPVAPRAAYGVAFRK
jgi:hypothetical protein